MPRVHPISLLGLIAQVPGLLAHPYNLELRELSIRDDPDPFVFAALGDSWASGVAYPGHFYDDDSSGCHRYSQAWSTYVKSKGSDWVPEGMEANLEFAACSGRRIDKVVDEMVDTSRPKVVLMEVGGNDADFYPMASACLFHDDTDRDYGTLYEDDDRNNPTGDCMKEINLVRGRLTGGEAENLKNRMVEMINKWRADSHVTNNAASLFLVGYAKMFNPDTKGKDTCDEWSFCVQTAKKDQNVKSGMREDFNEMVGYMNGIIESAVQVFNDPKIQFIDIDSAFKDHRFCEPGHSYNCQLNYAWCGKVWIWNSPARWWLKNGDNVEWSFDTGDVDAAANTLPPADFDKFSQTDGVFKKDQTEMVKIWTNPDDPSRTLEYRVTPPQLQGGAGGFRDRTLHPTKEGHEAMAGVIVDRLKTQDFSDVKRHALSIIMDSMVNSHSGGATVDQKWSFFTTKVGKAVHCADDKKNIHEIIPQGPSDPKFGETKDIDNPPWAGGEYKLNMYGEDCTYKCDGTNAGRLFCPNREIDCYEDVKKSAGESGTDECGSSRHHMHPVAFCEW